MVLTDTDQDELNAAFSNCKHSGVEAAKVQVEPLDWRVPRQQKGTIGKEFRTIVAADVAFSYPEAKALAKTVAHRLEPSAWYFNQPVFSSSKQDQDDSSLPRFVHVCPDSRDDVAYLHRLLNKGYKMAVSTGYLKIGKAAICRASFKKVGTRIGLGRLGTRIAAIS